MNSETKMNASELGALWMTYHKKTLILRILEYFIEKAEDEKAKKLMSDLWEALHEKIIEMEALFENEGAAVPEGFTKKDVNLSTPKLWENGFDIMFCRILKEVSMGMYVLHLTMSYRKDIIKLYQELSNLTELYYGYFTEYLLERKLLTRPNFVTMPKSTDYITDTSYAKGTNILGQMRELNTVEFGYLHQAIESNITGMQLLKGFMQTANADKVKKYFSKGKELTKKQIGDVSKILLDNDIQPPATPGGTVTGSAEAPFSDKLMLFCNYLLSGLSIGAGGFGAGFSLRNDLQLQNAIIGKDIFQYQREGAQLMMAEGWFEEPPRMEL